MAAKHPRVFVVLAVLAALLKTVVAGEAQVIYQKLFLIALMSARHFGKFHGGNSPAP
jgi:hypothetical protein